MDSLVTRWLYVYSTHVRGWGIPWRPGSKTRGMPWTQQRDHAEQRAASGEGYV